MEKDSRLLALIERLRADLDFDPVLVDHWDADLLATGIAHSADERTLVYVALRGDSISYQCERPSTSPDAPYDADSMIDDAGYTELRTVIRAHLNPPPAADL